MLRTKDLARLPHPYSRRPSSDLDNRPLFDIWEDERIYQKFKPPQPFEEWRQMKREGLRPACAPGFTAPAELLRAVEGKP